MKRLTGYDASEGRHGTAGERLRPSGTNIAKLAQVARRCECLRAAQSSKGAKQHLSSW